MGLASNTQLRNVEVDLSANDLRAQGAQVLENCVPTLPCVSSLNIAENSEFLVLLCSHSVVLVSKAEIVQRMTEPVRNLADTKKFVALEKPFGNVKILKSKRKPHNGAGPANIRNSLCSMIVLACVADFDLDIPKLCQAFSRNKTLKKLYLGKNFNNLKPK